jgi:phospho-N-acetylmuramoyl-pentapeptide-transferase
VLYYLLKYVGETYQIGWLRLVDYISFRALAAAVTALLIALIFGERIIAYLKTKVIEPIKEEAPIEHRKKVGIPSMGGSIILLSIFGASLLWSKLASPFAWLILLAVAWMGIIGFIDDYLKVIKKVKGGLSERYKLFGQLTLGLAIGIYTVLRPKTLCAVVKHDRAVLQRFDGRLRLLVYPRVCVHCGGGVKRSEFD